MIKINNSFFEKRCGALVYMTAGNLADAGAAHAFTTRFGGVSAGDFNSLNLGFNRGDTDENVTRNFEIICNALGVHTGGLVLAVQVHGDDIKIAGRADGGNGFTKKAEYTADALITAEPGLTLVVFTADCIPILLYDPKMRVIAAVHSGWRGTALGITRKTARMMKDSFACDGKDILAAIGPGISDCCFETDSDVPDAFYHALGDAAAAYIRKTGGKWLVDLKGINKYWLEAEGIENIAICSDCTMCMPDKYWSYRRNGAARGSQAAIITLV